MNKIGELLENIFNYGNCIVYFPKENKTIQYKVVKVMAGEGLIIAKLDKERIKSLEVASYYLNASILISSLSEIVYKILYDKDVIITFNKDFAVINGETQAREVYNLINSMLNLSYNKIADFKEKEERKIIELLENNISYNSSKPLEMSSLEDMKEGIESKFTKLHTKINNLEKNNKVKYKLEESKCSKAILNDIGFFTDKNISKSIENLSKEYYPIELLRTAMFLFLSYLDENYMFKNCILRFILRIIKLQDITISPQEIIILASILGKIEYLNSNMESKIDEKLTNELIEEIYNLCLTHNINYEELLHKEVYDFSNEESVLKSF